MVKGFQSHLFDIYDVGPVQKHSYSTALDLYDPTLDKKTLQALNHKGSLLSFRVSVWTLYF